MIQQNSFPETNSSEFTNGWVRLKCSEIAHGLFPGVLFQEVYFPKQNLPVAFCGRCRKMHPQKTCPSDSSSAWHALKSPGSRVNFHNLPQPTGPCKSRWVKETKSWRRCVRNCKAWRSLGSPRKGNIFYCEGCRFQKKTWGIFLKDLKEQRMSKVVVGGVSFGYLGEVEGINSEDVSDSFFFT